jgi:hypothetical protein
MSSLDVYDHGNLVNKKPFLLPSSPISAADSALDFYSKGPGFDPQMGCGFLLNCSIPVDLCVKKTLRSQHKS